MVLYGQASTASGECSPYGNRTDLACMEYPTVKRIKQATWQSIFPKNLLEASSVHGHTVHKTCKRYSPLPELLAGNGSGKGDYPMEL